MRPIIPCLRIFLLAVCFVVGSLSAQEVPLPDLERPVMDQTGTLTDSEIQSLESKILALQNDQGSQIGILIIPTLDGIPIEDFSIRLADKWKLGRKGVDDGVIIIVAKNDRTLRIEVGYGLEGPIPDAKANRIVELIIVPRFKQGEFYEGLDEGLDAIISLIRGEPLPSLDEVPLENQSSESGSSSHSTWIFIVVVVGALILRVIFNGVVGFAVMAPLGVLLGWFFIGLSGGTIMAAIFAALIGAFGRGGGSGGYSSSGGGGGFSSGGGGFSGGGGGFGGGGASGSW
ncbi:MAG: TPM domain-containing protein [Leptospiraceae bacterium]|nr:TPM domain-containing protein [Leptospiraceae bacterium]